MEELDAMKISCIFTPPSGEKKVFVTVRSLKEYIKMQHEGWQKFSATQSTSCLSNIRNWFNKFLVEIENSSDSNIQRIVDNVQNQLSSDNIYNVHIGTPYGDFLYKIPSLFTETKKVQRVKEYIEGAFKALFNQDEPPNTNELPGFVKASIFKEAITKKARKRKIDDLAFEYQIKANQANGLVDEITELFSNQSKDFSEFYTKTKNEIQKLETESKSTITNSTKELNSLILKFRETLRLKEPTKYWSDLERTHKDNAKKRLSGVICLTVTFLGLLVLTFWGLPNIELFNWNSLVGGTGINLNALKPLITVTLGSSLFVYLIRTMVKLTLSSFHLAEDARERLNLSHYYLALIEGDNIEAKERSIILQALFSRAETGLVKGESTPSLPGSITSVIAGLTNSN